VVKVHTVHSILWIEVFISSLSLSPPLPPPLLVHVNQCKEFVTANITVERMGIGLTGAYREIPEKLRVILRGLIHRIPYCALILFFNINHNFDHCIPLFDINHSNFEVGCFSV
jgi:hypothetical protein